MTRLALLEPGEPSPVMQLCPSGASPFVLLADHAGRRIPARLGSLGLPQSELSRHIGWDIGIWGVTERLSAHLDAPAIGQRYSRLVIDCNRPLDAPSSVPLLSEATAIPGNADCTEVARAARQDEIFRPYHDHIARLLTLRASRPTAPPTVLIAMHSFTPSFLNEARPWHIGTLYHRDARLAKALRDLLAGEPGLTVGDNQPYAASDLSDYAIPVHGERRGLPCVGLEIRQDLIADAAGQTEWAERLARLLPAAARAAQLL